MKKTPKHLLFSIAILSSSLNTADSYAFDSLENQYSNEIKASIKHSLPPYLAKPYSTAEQTALTELYQLNNHQLLWFSAEHPLQIINQLLSIFTQAPIHGLTSTDYASRVLVQHWHSIQQNTPAFTTFAQFDISLSLSLIRFLNDLHNGRITASQVNYHFPDKQFQPSSSSIYQAIQNNTLEQLIIANEPQLKPYQQLKKALTHYRRLNQYFSLQPHFHFKQTLRPGDWSTQVHTLHNYLNALNTDLNTKIQPMHKNSNTYTGAVVTKIRNFQANNSLVPDGIIGPQTLTLLNTPIKQRIEQIELAMERLRWLPEQQKGMVIMVNIPAFTLWAYDTSASDSEVLSMKVIVGKSFKRLRNNKEINTEEQREKERRALRTAIFSAELRHIIFTPYWNIPKNIFKKEILPRLIKQPDYLEKHNMEIVARFSPKAEILPITPENITHLQNEKLHLRQRPGSDNALGKVKFIFPNNYAIYLHDTPQRYLFNRAQRDFSHGCIRVENPSALTQFILQGENIDWTYKKSAIAMSEKTPSKVRVKQTIPVTIFYTTALATHSGVSFYPDIYDYDTELKAALQENSLQRAAKLQYHDLKALTSSVQ